MWSVLKESPLRLCLTIGYLAFAATYLAIGFLPARAESGQAEPLSSHLALPSVRIYRDVTESGLEHGEFYVSDDIVSVYRNGNKKFLMGHSETAFRRLENTRLFDPVFFEGKLYHITARRQQKIADINMLDIIADTPSDTLILMTCAGPNSSERLILTAQ